MERIVRRWADYILVHAGADMYSLIPGGIVIGDQIRAGSDEEAVQAAADIVRDRDFHGMTRPKAQKILSDLESSNHGDLLGDLDHDELSRFKNILFVWHDLACREIDRRAERDKK